MRLSQRGPRLARLCLALAASVLLAACGPAGGAEETSPAGTPYVSPEPTSAPSPAPSATPEPTPAPTPSPTPEPTPAPAPPGPDMPAPEEPLPEGYFQDAAFVGNSLVTGLELYDYDGLLAGADFYAEDSVTVLAVSGYIARMDGKSYGKVYIGLGINEIGYDMDTLRQAFSDMIAAIRSQDPDRMICLMSAAPVSRELSEKSPYFTKRSVLALNEMLYELAAEEEVRYLDVYAALADEDGYLPSNVTPDGVHFSASYYRYWFDLLRTHYLPE